MYVLILFLFVVGKVVPFPESPVIIDGITNDTTNAISNSGFKTIAITRMIAQVANTLEQQEQQELQQLRLEKDIQKQVRAEIDRTFNQIIILLYITLFLALGLPLGSLGFYWFMQRKLTVEISNTVQSLAALSQQLTKQESDYQLNNQSNNQLDNISIQQLTDRSDLSSNHLSDFQTDQQFNLSQDSTQDSNWDLVQNSSQDLTQDLGQDSTQDLGQIKDPRTSNIQNQQGSNNFSPSNNFSSIVATKERIMQELIHHLPPLSQEKILAGQEVKLVNLLEQLTTLLENHPDIPLVIEDYTNHAHALYFLEQDLAAIDLYDHSLNLQPEQPQAWHQKGTIHLKQSEYLQAIDAYNQAINLQADYAPSWYKLAYSYALAGELDLALSHLQRAVNLNPSLRTRARMSPDFNNLRHSDRFQSLVNLQTSP